MMTRVIRKIVLSIVCILCTCVLAPQLQAFDDCERIIQVVLSTGTPDQVQTMAQASQRFLQLRAAGLTEDEFVALGTQILDFVDSNLGSNPPVVIHDLMQLVQNPLFDQTVNPDNNRKLALVIKSLNKIKGFPGVLGKAGFNDGSQRLFVRIESSATMGFPFEAIADVYVIEVIGETPIGMSAKVSGFFEADLVSISPATPAGTVKCTDMKGLDGNWDPAEVQNAVNAILNKATLQVGNTTYTIGEFGFGVQAGETVPDTVVQAISDANKVLAANGFPPITITQNIPF